MAVYINKTNVQKPVVFLYTNNEHAEQEKTPKNPNLEINLTKEIKDLYNENVLLSFKYHLYADSL